MKKEYTVFSMRLAGYLMQRGHILVRIEKTKQDESKRNVFIFHEYPELIKDVHSYK